jgi:chemotaxis protein histidine kinase CheA
MTSEDKQTFLNEAGALLEQIGVELQMLDGNTSDLASVVAIIEKLDALKNLSENEKEERTFQYAFAMSELLSGVLCESFDNPEEILKGLEQSLGGLKAHLEALADDATEDQAPPRILTQLFEWLDVPMVKLEKIEVTGDIIFEQPTGESEQTSSELPAEPDFAQAETAPAAEPEPQTAETAATSSPLDIDLSDDEVASTGLPAAFDDVDLFREFAFEANEHLETIEETVLELESNPSDTDLINQIFRPIHSVKGGAGFLALTGMSKLAHTTETLLDRCRKLELPVTPEIIDICLKSSDSLQQMIANLINACEVGDPNDYDCLPVVYGPIRETIQLILDTENPHLTMGDTSGGTPPAAPTPEASVTATPQSEPAQAAAPPDEPKPEDGDLDDETWASKGIPPSLDDEEDLDLLKRFIFQCNEHTESIEEKILNLEEHPDDQELLDGVFRAIHSMKGDSGFLALTGISTLAHETETLLSKVRNGDIKMTGRPVELCLESVDALKQMIDNLNTWVEAKDRDNVELELIIFGPICEKIRTYLENPNAAPKLGELMMESGDLNQDQLDKALELQGAPLGEVLTKTGMSSPDKVAKALNQQKQSGGAGPSGAAKAIKVDTEKIDTLVNLVGELVIIEAQVAQMGSHLVAAGNGQGQILAKNLSQLGKITKELQDRSMSLRMMPIKQTFQKMQRLVRDSSKKVGKKVNLVLIGEDTELDKTVVEQIGDPLVHMLRNKIGRASCRERV